MYLVAVRSKTEVDNASTTLAQSNNEDDSDYEKNEENESDGPEMEDDTDEASHDAGSASNAGWADVMQKILRTNKPKRKKTLVLAKAKKLCDVKVKEKKEDLSFEIDGIKQENKTESEEVDETNITTNTASIQKSRVTKRKESDIRVKPSITDREHERMLQKIATK